MADDSLPQNKRFIEFSCFCTNKENPFCNLKIDDGSFLERVSEREICPSCNRSRRYYCYNCYIPVPEISKRVPNVNLPIKIDIIKHPKEVDGKSTSAHAAVLASNDVRVFVHPNIPCYDNEKVLLIFPGDSAVNLKDLLTLDPCNLESSKSCCQDTNEFGKKDTVPLSCWPFDRVIFIDSTWRQSKKLYNDTRFKDFPCAVLTSHKSVFWRYQKNKPETYLSTIEAIYYFLVEWHQLLYPNVPYCGRFDNLLFFFKFMYYKIRTLYDPTSLKAYQQD